MESNSDTEEDVLETLEESVPLTKDVISSFKLVYKYCESNIDDLGFIGKLKQNLLNTEADYSKTVLTQRKLDEFAE